MIPIDFSRWIQLNRSKNSPAAKAQIVDVNVSVINVMIRPVMRSKLTMNNLVQSVRATGGLGIVGVFVQKIRSAKDSLEKEGKIAFDFGTFFEKGQQMGTGQGNVKAYNRYLRHLIHHDRCKTVVDHFA